MRLLTLILAVLAAAAPTAAAQTPDSVARSIAEAINLPDAEQQRFITSSFSPAALQRRGPDNFAALFRRLREQSGGVRVVRAEPAGASTFATLASAKHPRYMLVAVAHDREQPGKLSNVQVLKSWHPAADSLIWPTRKLTESEVRAVIEQNVRKLAELDAFSGVVLVAKQDRVLTTIAYGYANLDHRVANHAETKFNFASMGKMFTAVAIAQLVEAGKLSFDDTLASVLPEYPNRENARRITIRQLLSHKAGLGAMFDDKRFDARRDYGNLLNLVSTVADKPLAFEPGTRWSYSNEGFEVLGAIVEKVSGMKYQDYVRRHIFTPANMQHTDNYRLDRVVPHRATGYPAVENDYAGIEGRVPNTAILGLTGTGAGGGYATASDIFKFARALQQNKLLSASMRDTLLIGREPLPWDASIRYGYGFMHSRVQGRDLHGHGGGGTRTGIDNDFAMFADGSYTIVVLSNYDPPSAHDLQRQLKQFLARQ